MKVNCECTECVHNEDGECNYYGVTISNNNLTAAGFIPVCQDYEEKE